MSHKYRIALKLLYLMPGKGMPEDELARRNDIVNSISRSDVSVSVQEVGIGPLSIESEIEEQIAIAPMLYKLHEIGKKSNYDAVIIGCAGDPGIRAVRELLDVPVIGPAESSYCFACMVSDRFSVLQTQQAGIESAAGIKSYIRSLGFENRLTSVEFVKSSVTDLWTEDSSAFIDDAKRAAIQAKSNGAGSIVLGCMSMGFQLLDEHLKDKQIPIVNPVKTAIKTAEMFVDMKIEHSRMTYPAADTGKLRETIFREGEDWLG